MKKKILAILLTAATILSLTGCGSSKFTCDFCEEEKSGKKHTETILGEEMTFCDDCYKLWNELKDALSE